MSGVSVLLSYLRRFNEFVVFPAVAARYMSACQAEPSASNCPVIIKASSIFSTRKHRANAGLAKASPFLFVGKTGAVGGTESSAAFR